MNNKQINEAFDEFVKNFNSVDKSVETKIQEIEVLKSTLTNELNKAKDEIRSASTEIGSYKASHEGRLNDAINNIESAKESLNEYYQILLVNDDSIKNQVETLRNEIEQYHESLVSGDESIKSQIEAQISELNVLRKEILGTKTKDPETGKDVITPGLKDKINELISDQEDQLKEFDSGINTLIEAKTKKMDDLLAKMEINYNDIEQEALSKKYYELAKEKSKIIKQDKFLLGLYTMFIVVSLAFLFTNSKVLQIFNHDDVNVFAGVLLRIAIVTPIVYLIIVTSSKMRREIKVRDQYNYKGSIMTTYRNISTHLKNEKIELEEDKQTELLNDTFIKILENESDKLDLSEESSFKNLGKMISDVSKSFGVKKEDAKDMISTFLEKREGKSYAQNLKDSSGDKE